MSEQLHNPEQLENLPPINPESGEFLDHMESEGKSRSKPITLNEDGVSKAAQDQFREIRKQHAIDSESGMNKHMEAGFPMPIKAKDEAEAARLIEKLIQTTQGDPFDEINLLSENIDNKSDSDEMKLAA
jgi:hypothetical protein